MIFPRRAGLFPSFNARIPRLPMTVQTRFFFDRAAVKSALSRLEHRGLSRASLLVRRTAQKSIEKVGAARPPLKVMEQNKGVAIAQLLKIPGLRPSTMEGLRVRISEIQNKPPSPPGTPPHTHVPHSQMLGFRRNIYNAMDPSMKSAIAGPSAKGSDPGIPHLHEFGGTRTLTAYTYQSSAQQQQAWHRDKLKWVNLLVRYADSRKPPGGRWTPLASKKTVTYPARPFMRPALQKSLPRIAKMFEGGFSAGMVRSSFMDIE